MWLPTFGLSWCLLVHIFLYELQKVVLLMFLQSAMIAPMEMWCYFVTPMLCVLYILSNRLSRYQSPRFLPLLRISSSGLLWAHFVPVIVSYIIYEKRKDPIHFCLCFGIMSFFFLLFFHFHSLNFYVRRLCLVLTWLCHEGIL